MGFHEVRFPAGLSLGSTGGPERRTEIVTLANGHEERNTPWSQSRRRYDAGLGMRTADDIAALIAFFEARQGRLHGFRWKDWADCTSCLPSGEISPDDQLLGLGDGARTEFRLCKHYASGASTQTREVTKPVAGSVRVAVGGAELSEGTGFTVDETSGSVALSVAPAVGVEIKAGFAFDVPVRFDTDRLDISFSGFSAGEVPSVPVVEIRV